MARFAINISTSIILGSMMIAIFKPVYGVLKGFDQATNLILDESHERVYSTKVCLCSMLPVSQFWLSNLLRLSEN